MKILKEGNKAPTSGITPAAEFIARIEEQQEGPIGLASLSDLLRTTLPSEAQPSPQQLRTIVDALSQEDRLMNILTTILHDPDLLRDIAAKSFGHSTGMERIELASSGQYALRLHYWMPEADEVITEDPHNHVYNFGSRILSGSLVTDLFTVTQGEGTPMNMFDIASQNSEEKPVPQHSGVAHLTPTTAPEGLIFTKHDPSYTMSTETIHRVRQGDLAQPIITLNLRGKAVKNTSTFFRNEHMQVANPVPVPVDVEDKVKLLLKVLEAKKPV